MAITLIKLPETQPVSLDQVKNYLKIDGSDDDQIITDLIGQAVSHIENLSDHKLINQSWRMFFDCFPADRILELTLNPVNHIEGVRFYDNHGEEQIVSSDDYELDTYSRPARLWIKSVLCQNQKINGLEVDLQAGFGNSGEDIPGNIIRAILATIAHWYEFRGAVHPENQPVSNPDSLKNLLAPYLRVRL